MPKFEQGSSMKIIKASKLELDDIATLFDLYRQFYNQSPDLESAKIFIENRLTNQESIIFLAISDLNGAIGFVQLYPSFSSVAMKKMWYLNDLFVVEKSRNLGVARSLLKHIKSFAQETNALTVKLATESTNKSAKALYESEGYLKITAFEHYIQRVI